MLLQVEGLRASDEGLVVAVRLISKVGVPSGAPAFLLST